MLRSLTACPGEGLHEGRSHILWAKTKPPPTSKQWASKWPPPNHFRDQMTLLLRRPGPEGCMGPAAHLPAPRAQRGGCALRLRNRASRRAPGAHKAPHLVTAGLTVKF